MIAVLLLPLGTEMSFHPSVSGRLHYPRALVPVPLTLASISAFVSGLNGENCEGSVVSKRARSAGIGADTRLLCQDGTHPAQTRPTAKN
jgi:hypothetical protein